MHFFTQNSLSSLITKQRRNLTSVWS